MVSFYITFFSDYRAFRNETHGSFFIEEFVLILELFSHIDHLEDIARKVGTQGCVYCVFFHAQSK